MNEKCWVTMTDTFMSGWGPARGKINKLVIECGNIHEAEIVAQNASDRTDQKNIRIAFRKPYYPSRAYVVSWHDKETYPCWFESGFFKRS
jgi:hypothetical protein